MNVSHRRRFVYLAPPRTASRYIATLLRPLGLVEPLTHCAAGIPPRGYFVFASVRNPYARWASCWRWVGEIASAPGAGDLSHYVTENPTDFVGWTNLAAGRGGPVSSIVGSLNSAVLDATVRQEHLAQDLRALPFAPRDWQVQQQPGGPWREFYDAETAQCVLQCWEDDFRSFGYDPHSWRQ